jgi:hypothetical protein
MEWDSESNGGQRRERGRDGVGGGGELIAEGSGGSEGGGGGGRDGVGGMLRRGGERVPRVGPAPARGGGSILCLTESIFLFYNQHVFGFFFSLVVLNTNNIECRDMEPKYGEVRIF